MSYDRLLIGLLHQLRNPAATLDTLLEFTAATRAASPEEVKLALLQFGGDLLSASRNVYRIHIAAAEFDQHEGGIH